ncbi:hypothetical protein [Mesorhizobium sp. WSM2239]|uniref:Uncharacterized protein n=2 Tax=unclassified Mesorhizobium TaxID=325217 RepID=A0AAU8DB33_9HYPH
MLGMMNKGGGQSYQPVQGQFPGLSGLLAPFQPQAEIPDFERHPGQMEDPKQAATLAPSPDNWRRGPFAGVVGQITPPMR